MSPENKATTNNEAVVESGYWEHWANRLLDEGMDPQRLEVEFERYQNHEQTWPEGVADYRRLMSQIFEDLLK